MEQNDLALITPEDMSLVEGNTLNELQLKQIFQKTPKQYIKERPAKGGGKWRYVTGGYIKKVLNLMFGWDWDFEVVETKEAHGQVVVLGKLTCRITRPDGTVKQIVKMQYGGKDIAYRSDIVLDEQGNKVVLPNGKFKTFKTNEPLDYGNDCKAACTDALKKCAAELGIAADIYNADEFREVKISTLTLEKLEKLYSAKRELCATSEREQVERVIANEEEESYSKAYKLLKSKI